MLALMGVFIVIVTLVQSVVQMMECPAEELTQRTYNIAAFSFTPAEIVAEVQKYVPLTVEYKVDKTRQKIGKDKKIPHKGLFWATVWCAYVLSFKTRMS